jgi:hypothetical protein
MKYHRLSRYLAVIVLALACAARLYAEPESKRLAHAKDLIADEQWTQAVDVLRQAVRDPKEPNKDEILFWLAHSQNQVRDTAAALDTIGRLERDFHASPWVKPAQSLRIEIAQRMRRSDVLWYTATPPPPPPASVPPRAAAPAAVPVPAAPVAPVAVRRGELPPAPPAPPTPAQAATTPAPPAPAARADITAQISGARSAPPDPIPPNRNSAPAVRPIRARNSGR